jgi:hypothetical protein
VVQAQTPAAAAASSRSTRAEVSHPFITVETATDADNFPPGGKHFSRDLRPLDADGNEISMWSKDAKPKASDEDSEEDSDEEEESEEESEDDGAGPSAAAGGASAAELSREERKAEKKARKEAAIARAKKPVEVGDLPPSDSEEDEDEADMPANPNHSRKARNQTKAPATVKEATEAVEKLSVAPSNAPSRREREAMEAAAAKERYRKLHEAGKTDEAKADLARLKLIREKREAEAARKQVCPSRS